MSTPIPNNEVPANSQNDMTAEESSGDGSWQLTSLTDKHKQVATLLAQGVDRKTISSIVGWTPEYISMLARQPLIKKEVQAMASIAELQLEAMFVDSVGAIKDTLTHGNHTEKMKAARLQMEATRRIGSHFSTPEKLIDSNARLTKLAERLLYLQGGGGRLINGDIDEKERS